MNSKGITCHFKPRSPFICSSRRIKCLPVAIKCNETRKEPWQQLLRTSISFLLAQITATQDGSSVAWLLIDMSNAGNIRSECSVKG